MKKVILPLILVVILTTSAVVFSKEKIKSEDKQHPRIEKAIQSMEDVLDYLEKAPDTFGGNKADAIKDTKKAIESLNKALKFSEKKENEDKKDKKKK